MESSLRSIVLIISLTSSHSNAAPIPVALFVWAMLTHFDSMGGFDFSLNAASPFLCYHNGPTGQ